MVVLLSGLLIVPAVFSGRGKMPPENERPSAFP
jgi:hypothetical protein